MNEKTKTYQPDLYLKKGYLTILKSIVIELIFNKWLTFQLFKRDFLATYKQSIIGVLWAFIIPFFSVGTFVILNRSGVFSIGKTSVPYSVYAISGIAIWQLFSTGLILSANSLLKAGSMIVKINFSKKSLVIAAYFQALIPFVIQFLIVIALFVYYGIVPSIYVVMTPLLILPIILFTFGLGLVLSLTNAIFRDIGNILSVLITFLMFLTPIFYNKPDSGILVQITKFNILYYLVTVPRELILFGSSNNILGFLVSSLVSLIIFYVCLVGFHISEVRIAEKV